MKKQTLYLKSWEYNSYLLLHHLKSEVIKNGGCVVDDITFITSEKTQYTIYNRTLLKCIEELKETITTIENNLKNNEYDEERKKQLIDYKQTKKEALEKLEKIKNKKIVYNRNWLHFKLDNYIYYIQFDENPFFPHYIHKEKIDKIKDDIFIVNYSHYIDNLKDDNMEFIFNDTSFFEDDIKTATFKKIAKRLLKVCTDWKESEIVYTKEKKYCYSCGHTHTETTAERKQRKYKAVE